MSPKFWEIFGYTPDEKKHHYTEWQDIIDQKSLQEALQKFDMHIKTKGNYPYYVEAKYIHKNGSHVWVICKGKVIEWDDDGNPIRMVGTHTDITEIKKK